MYNNPICGSLSIGNNLQVTAWLGIDRKQIMLRIQAARSFRPPTVSISSAGLPFFRVQVTEVSFGLVPLSNIWVQNLAPAF
jgi:hypothetical protein